jgi:chaperone surA
MKFYALIAAMLLSGRIAFAHTDPIVMIIDGQSVKKSEFEYFYQKNHLGNTVDSKSVKVFADGFVNYKLKVQAAKDAHLDTLPNIRRVLKRYDDVESCELMPDKGSVHVAHILLRLGQKASYHEQEVVERRIDSIYQALCKGADFADLAKKCSDDKGSAVNGGTLAWFTKGQTVQAFEKVAFSLRKSEISRPFMSEFGYHIVKLLDKHDDGNQKKYVADAKVENWRGTYQQQEEVENLLLNEICQRNIWYKAAADKKGLAAFYAKNKKKYKWEMKRLNKMKVNLPRNGKYPDVVLADYQDSLEKQWVAQLKKKYKVVVFHSMLTTLNIH